MEFRIKKGKGYLQDERKREGEEKACLDAYVTVRSRLWSEEVTGCSAGFGVQESNICCIYCRRFWTSVGGEST